MAVQTEVAVIDSLCEYLIADGWEILSRAAPYERGPGIAATRRGVRLEIEARGAGSSKSHTARYGLPFTTAQVKLHVGQAVLKALQVVAAGDACAAVAFPDGPDHRSEAGAVQPVLERIGIKVFWVSEDGTVTTDNHSSRGGEP